MLRPPGTRQLRLGILGLTFLGLAVGFAIGFVLDGVRGEVVGALEVFEGVQLESVPGVGLGM